MRGQANRTKSAKRRNFLFSERATNRLVRLVDRTDASSETEVIKNALLTYEALVDWLEEGATFFARNARGQLIPIDLLIDVSRPFGKPSLRTITNDDDDSDDLSPPTREPEEESKDDCPQVAAAAG